MATDAEYGADVSTYPDLDATGRFIDGPRAVAERVCRRLETDPAFVSGFVPDDECRDLRDLLSVPLSAGDLAMVGVSVENIALSEDSVATAAAVVTFDADSETLTVVLTGELLETGPFRWVVGITAAAVLLLEET